MTKEPERESTSHVWMHMTHAKDYARHPLTLTRGRGALVWDSEGNEYIDAVSAVAVTNVGHGRREVIDAVHNQIRDLEYASIVYAATKPAVELARKLAAITPGDLEKVFFTTGGSEAVETAIKMARQYQVLSGREGRYRVMARWMSYHGGSLGALSAAGHPIRRRMFAPLLLDFPHVPPPYCYRCFFGKTYPECDTECARSIDRTIRAEGEGSISAFIAEPVVGYSGVIVPPPEYLPMVREICDKYDILLLADEVITGFGRTGKMFGCENWGVVPDILILAKGMASGYVPLGAAVVRERVTEAFERSTSSTFVHAFTFGGHPAACAAGLACIEIMERERLSERAAELGKYMMKQLKALDSKIIGEVRGLGLFLGIELVRDRETKEAFGENEPVGRAVMLKAREKGVIISGSKGSGAGLMGDLLLMAPPLVTGKEQIDRIVEVVGESIAEVERTL
ncbi:MAG: aspartate aminotransferase family protein [Candidatus Bathyarchaeia archaeon]